MKQPTITHPVNPNFFFTVLRLLVSVRTKIAIDQNKTRQLWLRVQWRDAQWNICTERTLFKKKNNIDAACPTVYFSVTFSIEMSSHQHAVAVRVVCSRTGGQVHTVAVCR